jgi:hypothetical protein
MPLEPDAACAFVRLCLPPQSPAIGPKVLAPSPGRFPSIHDAAKFWALWPHKALVPVKLKNKEIFCAITTHLTSHEIYYTYNMSESGLLRKDQLELSLHQEKKLIQDGIIKEDNPLDVSENFHTLCMACRKGDLKVCQEMITEGVNINSKDLFDYTPLILVSLSLKPVLLHSLGVLGRRANR